MFTAKLRSAALFVAFVTVLSTVLIGCAQNKDVNDQDIGKGVSDIRTLLDDAYEKTSEAKSLSLSIQRKNDTDHHYFDGSDKLSGTFGETEEGDFAALLTEKAGSGKDKTVTEWYYLNSTRFGYDGNSTWAEKADKKHTLASACMEDWVLSSLAISDFNTFTKALSKAENVSVINTKDEDQDEYHYTVTLCDTPAAVAKVLTGSRFTKGALSSEEEDALTLSLSVNEGYLTEILLEGEWRQGEISVEIEMEVGNKEIVEAPEWVNDDQIVPDNTDPNAPYLTLNTDLIYIKEGASVYLDDYITDGNFDRYTVLSLNNAVVRASNDGELYGRSLGEGEIAITVINNHGSKTYRLPVKVIAQGQTAPVINIPRHELTMKIGSTINLYNYFYVEFADEITFEVGSQKVISINPDGTVHALQTGGTHIVIKAQNKVGSAEEYLGITVTSSTEPPLPPPVDLPEVALFEDKALIDVGGVYHLGDMCFTLADELRYVSNDPSIARVDAATGVITGVSEGQTFITIAVIVDGEAYAGAKFPVIVRAPWNPTDPASMEVLNAKNLLTRYETFDWFLSNVCNMPEYNVRGDENTAAGPVEIWADTLQMCFWFNQGEMSAIKGIEDISTYNYYFDFYYRPYDENNDRGEYKKAVLQPWSIYTAEKALYRFKFYDEIFVKNDGLVEDQLYEVVIVVREGENQLGYAEAELTWTDSCAIFVEAAEQDLTIIK